MRRQPRQTLQAFEIAAWRRTARRAVASAECRVRVRVRIGRLRLQLRLQL